MLLQTQKNLHQTFKVLHQTIKILHQIFFSSPNQKNFTPNWWHFWASVQTNRQFQCFERIINSFVTHSLSFIFMRARYYQKRIFRNNSFTHFLSFVPIRNRIKYKKILAASSHISWVIKHSVTNLIVEG